MAYIIRAPKRAPKSETAADVPPPSPPTVEQLAQTANLPATLADDLLEGVGPIAKFLYGPDAKAGRARTAISKGLPVWKLGNRFMARRSTLIAWIAKQERG